MSAHAEQTQIQLDVTVDAPIERAFEVFVGQFDTIKPREHNLLQVEIAETVFERHVGGHIVDRGIDGSECRWARVLVYEPPERVVFSWEIGTRWQLESDPARASEVEVRFTAESPTRTRVELEHRHFDRHGDGWEMARDAIGGDGGWPTYLERYAGLIG
jgi:uncharacterized protein YndB with AHSA1/START domain